MKVMKSKGTILDATIAVYMRSFPDSTLYQYGVSLTRLAYETGVKIGVGTDIAVNDFTAPAPIFREMRVLQDDVKMEPIDVIRGATIINAEMMDQESRIGSIEVGKQANLVITKKNPTEDINHLKNPSSVIKNGKFYESK